MGWVELTLGGTQAFLPETVLIGNGSGTGSFLPSLVLQSQTSEDSGLLPFPSQGTYLSLNRLESKSGVCVITQWPEELPASNLGSPHGGNGYSY